VTDSPNLQLVRSIYAAWERGDVRSNEWADAKIEVVFVDGPSPGIWKGYAGLAEGWREVLSAWEDFHAEIEDCRDLDPEHVLVLQRFGGRGKTSGLDLAQMQTRSAHVFEIRDGRVTRLTHYFDRDRALADLGLTPEGDTS
jgi:ketosteroid isomerase-like protein